MKKNTKTLASLRAAAATADRACRRAERDMDRKAQGYDDGAANAACKAYDAACRRSELAHKALIRYLLRYGA